MPLGKVIMLMPSVFFLKDTFSDLNGEDLEEEQFLAQEIVDTNLEDSVPKQNLKPLTGYLPNNL